MRTFQEIEDNILATQFEGYAPRAAQQDVARFIEGCIADREHGMIQAPVGTGKSFAALIPVINWVIANPGRRVLIATATNLLAQQYDKKDLPNLARMYEEVLGDTFTHSLVKGRRHYVCNWELNEQVDNASALKITKELETKPGHTGDFDDFEFSIPNEDRAALSVGSTECPGMKSCAIARQQGCFSSQARNRANDAQIVVTNISALVTNARLMGNLLGDYDLIIVDEAHNMDQYTLGSMEEQLNFEGMRRLIDQARNYYELTNEDEVITNINQMEDDAKSLVGDDTFRKITETDVMDNVAPFIPVYQAMHDLKARLGVLGNSANTDLEEAEEEGRVHENSGVLEDVARNAKRLAKQATGYLDVLTMLLPLDPPEGESDEQVNIGAGMDHVRWISAYEVRTRKKGGGRESHTRVKYHTSPIETAQFLRRYIWDGNEDHDVPPAIMMSGTLAPGGDFSYIKRTLGAPKEIRECVVDSPFDFESQGMMYVPEASVPIPNPAGYEDWFSWFVPAVNEIVKSSKGDALLLFTSRKNMEAAYELLSPGFNRLGYKPLMQDGEMTTGELSAAFMSTPGSVLFGLKSFFEGFDPKRGKVKALVIDKLPFPVPTDIIFEARSQKINHQMRDNWASFRMLSVPQMALVLDQGVGRLIRSDQHEGVVFLMDSRLVSKSYGKQIVKGLPPFARTNTMSEALDRLERIKI